MTAKEQIYISTASLKLSSFHMPKTDFEWHTSVMTPPNSPVHQQAEYEEIITKQEIKSQEATATEAINNNTTEEEPLYATPIPRSTFRFTPAQLQSHEENNISTQVRNFMDAERYDSQFNWVTTHDNYKQTTKL